MVKRAAVESILNPSSQHSREFQKSLEVQSLCRCRYRSVGLALSTLTLRELSQRC